MGRITYPVFDTDRWHDDGISENLEYHPLCLSFHRFEFEDDFSLVGVVEVFVADLVGDHSALDRRLLLSDQAEPNSHQRVDISRLRKRSQAAVQIVGYCCVCFFFFLGHHIDKT